MPIALPPYILYLLTAILAAVISIYGVRKTIFIARDRKLYDKPDDIRKIHGAGIPSMGGIGIFLGYVIASVIYWPGESAFMPFFIVSSAILLFTGIYDDIVNMRPSKKLVAQLLASAITIYFANTHEWTFNGTLSSELAGLVSYTGLAILLTLCCTFFINVFNFIDGIDGLACSLGILYTLSLAVLFICIHQPVFAGVCFALMGATAGLLWFNRSPAKIYMGDTGSMFLGFSIFILSLLFIFKVDNNNLQAIASYVHNIQSAQLLITAMLFLPVFDAIRVFLLRMSRGVSPFKADRTHLHYYLLDAGFTHSQAVMAIVGTNILTIALTYIMQDANPLLTLACMTALSIAVLGFVHISRQKKIGGSGK